MVRCVSLAFAALAACAPTAHGENQIWTSLDLKKASTNHPQIAYELNTELRYQPDGDLDTIEIRPGVSYKLDNGLKLSGGYLFASSRRAGPDRREHRLWQMVSYDLFSAGDGKFAGRSRLEERWPEHQSGTGWRLRQQVSFTHPIGDTGLDLALSDEVTMGLNTTNWGNTTGLQENRAKAVVKWKMAGAGWEAGYLNQYRNGVNGAEDETNDHIFLGVSKDF